MDLIDKEREPGFYWSNPDDNGDVWAMRYDGKLFWSHDNSFRYIDIEMNGVSDEPITREPGSYWVRKGADWFVAEFSELREWLLNLERMPTRGGRYSANFDSVGDCYFDEIDELRIVRQP